MWETTAKWLIDNHGILGVFIIALAVAIVGLSAALVFIFKKYVALNKEIAGQAEKCRECLRAIDERHDKAIAEFYEAARKENSKMWDRMEAGLNRVCDATTGLSNVISNLSGRFNGLGRNS